MRLKDDLTSFSTKAGAILSVLIFLPGCAARPARYCTETGQPAREAPPPYKIGNKQCSLKKGPDGQYVKNGAYIEWFPDGTPALQGEFTDGKKSGKWIQWDESGRKVSERWFENGVETLARGAQVPKDPLSPKPASTAQTPRPGQRPR